MKSTIKRLWIVAMAALIGFSMSSCSEDKDEDKEDIIITVTGDFSEYIGWKAHIGLEDDYAVAWAMPLNVKETTTSLPFTMFRYDDEKPFNKPGTYMVVLWFENDDEEFEDYAIVGKRINEGANSIEFSAFR